MLHWSGSICPICQALGNSKERGPTRPRDSPISVGAMRTLAGPMGRAIPSLLLLLKPLIAFASNEAPVTAEELRQVASKRIFFAHQSVGGNVLDGVRALADEQGVPVPIREWKAGEAGAGLLHAMVGQNEAPLSKVSHFEKLLDEGAAQADVAFYKFCYVDFTKDTDVDALFVQYQRSVEALQAKHPGVKLVHVTTPLTTVQRGVKGWIKEKLGKGAWGANENIKRHQFNERLRQTYGGKAPVFDLAQIESELGGGQVSTFTRGGQRYPSMNPAFTDDGGHLNAQGRKVVAARLVRFLAALP